MLKRFGLAGLLFATLAVTPLTVAAQDRNDAFRNNREPRRTEYVRNTRDDFRGHDDRFREINHRDRFHYIRQRDNCR